MGEELSRVIELDPIEFDSFDNRETRSRGRTLPDRHHSEKRLRKKKHDKHGLPIPGLSRTLLSRTTPSLGLDFDSVQGRGRTKSYQLDITTSDKEGLSLKFQQTNGLVAVDEDQESEIHTDEEDSDGNVPLKEADSLPAEDGFLHKKNSVPSRIRTRTMSKPPSTRARNKSNTRRFRPSSDDNSDDDYSQNASPRGQFTPTVRVLSDDEDGLLNMMSVKTHNR
eukprot:UN25641